MAALLLLGHAEPQLQLRSLSIFATGVLVALSPRLLRASYVVQSTVAERIECNPGPSPPPAGSDPLTDLHLDSALRLLRLRARFEFVPQTMLYPSVAVSLQDTADGQSKQEAARKTAAASVQGPQQFHGGRAGAGPLPGSRPRHTAAAVCKDGLSRQPEPIEPRPRCRRNDDAGDATALVAGAAAPTRRRCGLERNRPFGGVVFSIIHSIVSMSHARQPPAGSLYSALLPVLPRRIALPVGCGHCGPETTSVRKDKHRAKPPGCPAADRQQTERRVVAS